MRLARLCAFCYVKSDPRDPMIKMDAITGEVTRARTNYCRNTVEEFLLYAP